MICSEDFFQSHPAAKVLATWCHDLALEPNMWAADPMGYRTRGKLAVGSHGSGVIIGLFKRGTWKVQSCEADSLSDESE